MSNTKIPILMYHSIESMPKSTVMRSLHVPPRRFKFQMWLLKKIGYQGLSIKELQPYLDGLKRGKVVGITFDDGYQNILHNAAPILKKYNFSATCYIVSGCIGTSNTWDLDNGITQRPLMKESEIKAWIKMGMDIGAHTKTHADLTTISEASAKNEISECKIELEKKYKIKITDFCYPFGRFNKLVCNMTKELGFYSATTMNRGRANPQSNNYMLPRIPINHHTLPHLFLAKILTEYEDRRH
ncbi:polysaccharide deacetylase family protein [Candidatus Thioglobus sp.]|jgi:peptidoglycan/xylan/chitin deacetylase (PgdA/CDA1 family)|nr:polysaccharide deacetylase family protein [Candidatus Thioglobus sp.]